ncbi:Alcohol dehydrogenase GroES domain protein [Ignisphaera aggregans DSM 17230]|uniref:Alcohol dehydrogenase GroES domain protein n=1 Tax=Ignisphaera aggregans (strain DSM 17230 / JCM 13409 / AQ1.S1) TaxID=583356 RepID=E0SQT5_IGNAA|nr:Alcohol dehydrogenase GroES domain protein [Ignisphaera aggregans DSM 17230]
MSIMKALVIIEPRKAEVRDVDIPEPRDNEVLVRVRACGLCQTDRHIYEGEFLAKYPIIPGHEFSGEVIDTGKNVDMVRKGDRVVIDPNISCGRCYYCRSGMKHLCENWQGIGVTLNGGFAEYALVPQENVYIMPRDLSFEAASLTEPLACIIHGIDRIGMAIGKTIAIFGAGPIGLMFLQLLRHFGASKIVVFDINDYRLEVAKKLSADYVYNPRDIDISKAIIDEVNRYGIDIVVEASGSLEAFKQALKIVGYSGRILVFGVPPRESEVGIRLFDVYRKEISIIGSFVNPYTMYRALDILRANIISVNDIITHRVSLMEILDILKGNIPRNAIKIVSVF